MIVCRIAFICRVTGIAYHPGDFVHDTRSVALAINEGFAIDLTDSDVIVIRPLERAA